MRVAVEGSVAVEQSKGYVAFLSFDFFLVPPLYTFTIGRWEEWLALGVFLATALLTSHWTSVMRQSIEDARQGEREAQILKDRSSG